MFFIELLEMKLNSFEEEEIEIVVYFAEMQEEDH